MFASESLPHGRSWEWWSVSTLINHANIWFINHGWFIKSLYICWKTSSMSQTPGSLAPFRPPASVPQEPKLRAPSWSPLWGQKPQMQVAMTSTYACTLWYMASFYILSCSLFADVLYFQDRFSRNFGDIYRAYIYIQWQVFCSILLACCDCDISHACSMSIYKFVILHKGCMYIHICVYGHSVWFQTEIWIYGEIFWLIHATILTQINAS